MQKIRKTSAQWLEQLGPEAFRVCREKGTERPFSGAYWQCGDSVGRYLCRCCGQPLFAAEDKFDSGSGWPSFTRPVARESVESVRDTSHGMIRTEVVCARCDAHLGHVFDDGPAPTGQRFCINSLSLQFEPEA